MNSFFSLNSLKVFGLALFMVLATVVYATEGNNDNNKNSQKESKKEQVEQDNAANDASVDAAQSEEPATDEEGVSMSSVSFNFIFYLIYKIKYADIFKIVNRRQDESNSSGWSGVNLNRLYQKLAPPAI